MDALLRVKARSMERLKLTEIELLAEVQNMRAKVYKSDLSESNKILIDDTIKIMEEVIKDLFASEYARSRLVGNTSNHSAANSGV